MKEEINVLFIQEDSKFKNGMLDKKWAFFALKDGDKYIGFACDTEFKAQCISSYFKQMANALKKKAKKK